MLPAQPVQVLAFVSVAGKFRALEGVWHARNPGYFLGNCIWVLSEWIIVMEIAVSLVLLFVGIAVLIIIHFRIVGRTVGRGYGNGATAQRGEPGMSRDELKKLPRFEFKAVAQEKTSNSLLDCAVCLENFKKGDSCRLLPNCKHLFHSQCIDSWLLKTPICPICRTCATCSKISMSSAQQSGISTDVGAELT